MRPPPILLTLVAGPTASGKTRAINAAPGGEGQARAVSNDRGRTPLAPGRALDVDFPGPTLSTCLCCAAGRFPAMLEQVLRGLDNGRVTFFSRLYFETAGDADPAVLAGEVIAHPYLSRRFALTEIAALFAGGPPADPAAAARQIDSAGLILADAGAMGWTRLLAALHNQRARLLPMAEGPAAIAALPPFAAAALPETARRRLRRMSPGGAARIL